MKPQLRNPFIPHKGAGKPNKWSAHYSLDLLALHFEKNPVLLVSPRWRAAEPTLRELEAMTPPLMG